MKFLFFLLITMALATLLHAQQAVGIGTPNPHSTSVLELSSTSKGLLIPRMTASQRLAIGMPGTPATGLMVYETTSGSFWGYNGSAWVQLASGGASPWTISGTSIFNTNSGNVGIGQNTPQDRLDVDGSARLTGGSRLLKMETSVAGPSGQFTVYKYAPGIQFIRSDGSSLGKIEYVDTLSFSNFLRMYAGSLPTNDLTVTTDHNVGIGTADPVARLQVSGGLNEQVRIYSPAGGTIQFTSGFVTNQLKKGFLEVTGNDVRIGTNPENNLGNLVMRVNGRNSLTIDPAGTVNMPTGPDAGLASDGLLMLGNAATSNLVFDNNEILARNNGAAATLVLQNDGGSVRIGNVAAPADYKFAINGKMICEELKVKLASSGWPDYVFANDYKLKSLSDLRRFIDQNKHLPGIPAAAEVEKNGIEVGDMQRKLMEKVEELTLYILQLEDKINRLDASIKNNK